MANSSGPVYLSVTNLAVQHDGGTPHLVTNITGHLFVPQTPEAFTYDLDGNLTSDGRWTYAWDSENRLTQVESHAATPTASKRKVLWEFDGQGRRIRQTTYDGSGGSYVITEDLKLVSDGWRHIAELNATNSALVRSYVWGLDLSGTKTGAGGVGGLLMLNSAANGAQFYAYDGNGNIVALVKATDGTVSANYEYEPFGSVLRATGLMADENRFQFSTKRNDRTTDIELYEFRVRRTDFSWLSRDPVAERGGQNLYGYAVNDPLSKVDPLGLWIGGPRPSCNISGLLRKCCPDKCKREGDIERVDVIVKYLPPDITPEQEDELKMRLSELGSLENAATLVEEIVSCGVYAGVLGTIGANSMDWKHEMMEALYNKTRNRLLYQYGVITYTKLVYRWCRTERCFFIGPKRLNWSVPLTSDQWKPCTIGAMPSLGYYGSLEEAVNNLEACIEAHEKQEFGQ